VREGEPEAVLARLWLGHRSNGDLGPLPGLGSFHTNPELAIPGRQAVDDQAETGLADIENRGLRSNKLGCCRFLSLLETQGGPEALALVPRNRPLAGDAHHAPEAERSLNRRADLGDFRPGKEKCHPLNLVPEAITPIRLLADVSVSAIRSG
jgi:hypothetical protein